MSQTLSEEWIGNLEGLSSDPLRRAAQIALTAIDRTIAAGDGTLGLDIAYEALQAALIEAPANA
jgi:hypothetical protein